MSSSTKAHQTEVTFISRYWHWSPFTWASWSILALVTPLFVQQHVEAYNKDSIKLCITDRFRRLGSGFPSCYHMMMSSFSQLQRSNVTYVTRQTGTWLSSFGFKYCILLKQSHNFVELCFDVNKWTLLGSSNWFIRPYSSGSLQQIIW